MITVFKLAYLSFKPRVYKLIFLIEKLVYILSFGSCKLPGFEKLESKMALNRVSFFKTVYFNLRSLRFSIARKLPIHIYTGTKIINSSGKIKIENTQIKFGMIRWGIYGLYRSQGNTVINNKGLIIFRGPGIIDKGAEVVVFTKATIDFGTNIFIGENVLVYSQYSIKIGEWVRISYQSDICDSDFHYCIDIATNIVTRKNKRIIIGNYNWIGNKTTIKKGTITPDYILVASAYSVLSKDYRLTVPEYSVLGGCPAKVIKTGISRIWYKELETIKVLDQEIGDKISIEVSDILKQQYIKA